MKHRRAAQPAMSPLEFVLVGTLIATGLASMAVGVILYA